MAQSYKKKSTFANFKANYLEIPIIFCIFVGKMEYIVVIMIVAASVLLLSVGVILRKDHRFHSEDVGGSEAMRKRGIYCATTQDRLERRGSKVQGSRLKASCILLLAALMLAGCGVKVRLKNANRKYAIGEYYAAAEEFKGVYGKISAKTEKPLKAEVAYKMGDCYQRINSPKSINAYKNAVRYHYEKQDSIVFLQQAKALHYQGNYKEAKKSYELYLEAHPDNYEARAGAAACEKVQEWKREPYRYKYRVVKELNNRRGSSFCPMLMDESGDQILFTSNRPQGTKSKDTKKVVKTSKITGQMTYNLWESKKDQKGKWTAPELAEGLYEDANANENENKSDSAATEKKTGQRELGICCLTDEGRTMYFTFSCPENGKDLGAKIYQSSRSSGQWADPQEFKIFKDSSITAAHPAWNKAADTLYFVSDAPGGYGGKDIWRAVQEGGDWIAENAGPVINTSGNEMFPYVREDGRLYFASDGQPGYGGLDLFYVDSTGEVVNMGQPFNGPGDDFGICFVGKTNDGYWSSNRGQKKGTEQIYEFVLPEMVFQVQGKVTDQDGNPVDGVQLRLVGTDGMNTKLPAKKDGSYSIKVNKDARYVMLATARGYLNVKGQFVTTGLKDSHTYTEDFVMMPVSKPVRMDNVFYEFGKWEITPESSASLDKLVKLLSDNPNITIELAAHTDMKGDSTFNAKLSQKRAESVVNYLISKGIEKERLTPVGYGESIPVIVNEALHKQYKWMPVGQVLDEAFITGLKEEQQEKANQENRRTEFKVLRTTYKLY